MNTYTLQIFMHNFYEYKFGTIEDLTPWIDLCKEENFTYKLFNPQNEEIA